MMKKYFTLLMAACASVMVLSLSSCDNDDPSVPPPSLSVKAGVATDVSISFEIAPVDANVLYYKVVKEGEMTPTIEQIISSGVKGDSQGTKTYTAAGLEYKTNYIVAAVASSSGLFSQVATVTMTTDPNAGPSIAKPDPTAYPSTWMTAYFTLTTANATAAAWQAVAEGEKIPTAAEILADGTPITKLGEAVTVKVEGLKPGKKYTVYAVQAQKESLSEVMKLPLQTKAEPTYDTDVANPGSALGAYYADVYSTQGTGEFIAAWASFPVDEEGYATGAGFNVQFDFYTKLAADMLNARPQSGTYTLMLNVPDEELGTEWAMNETDSNWAETDDTGRATVKGAFTEAVMEITALEDGTYSVIAYATGTGVDPDKNPVTRKFRLSYEGPIAFAPPVTPVVAVDVTGFKYGMAVYTHTEYTEGETANWSAQFANSIEDEDLNTVVTLDFYTPIATDVYHPTLDAGTYTLNDGLTYDAFTYNEGDTFLGWFDMGCYVQVLVDNSVVTGYVKGGTFTINDDGTVKFDMVLADQLGLTSAKLTGSYTDPITIKSAVPEVPSGDQVMALGVEYISVYYGDSGENTYDYYVRVSDVPFLFNQDTGGVFVKDGGKGNMLNFDFYSTTAPTNMANIELPTGTYALDPEATLADGTCHPEYTWWLVADANGNQTTVNYESATIKVDYSAGLYTIRIDAETSLNLKLQAIYFGGINFQIPDAAPGQVRKVRNFDPARITAERKQKTIAPYMRQIMPTNMTFTQQRASIRIFK